MEQKFQQRRAFEHDLRNAHPSDKDPNPGRLRDPSLPYAFYQRLMTMEILNTYDNGQEGRSFGLSVHPTEDTVSLMRSLGMLLKLTASGFVVLYDQRRQFGLVQYIRNNAIHRQGEYEYWTRLSFALATRGPYFVSSIRFPIAANPSIDNFYLTNQKAKERCGYARLNPPGAFLPKNRLPVASVQFEVRVPRGGGYKVYDISGTVVLCVRGVSEVHPKDLPDRRRRDGNDDILYVDMALVPEGKYYLEATDAWGDPAPRYDYGWYVYTRTAPAPLFFVDLLLARPRADEKGVYPVTDLRTKELGKVTSITYHLQFFARASTFRYRVVQNTPRYSAFSIESADPKGPIFRFDERVLLPDGTWAWDISSTSPIRLSQQPSLRLRLRGQIGDTWDVLVDKLPIPSPAAVSPYDPPKNSSRPSQENTVPLDPFNSLIAQPTRADVYVYV